MAAWRQASQPGEDRAEDLALGLLRAITRPKVRDAGLEGAVRALVEAVGASAAIVVLDDPPHVVRLELGKGLEPLDTEPRHTGREADVPLVHDGETIGRLRLLGLPQIAVVQQALAYVAGDLGWIAARHAMPAPSEIEGLKVEIDRLTQIVQSIPDGVVLVSATERVVGWNEAMEQLTGRTADRALLQPWSGLLDLRDDRGTPLRRSMFGYTAAKEGRPVDFREVVQIQPAEGQPRWVEVAFAPTSASAQGHGVVMVIRDVSARRDVERSKEDFLATASRELRAPLTPLQGVLELLDRAGELPSASAERIREAAARQIERLERLADDIVTMVDLDRHLAAGAVEEFDPRATAITVIASRGAAADQRIDLDVPRPLTVRSSPALVARILETLVDNAIEHTRGPVTLRISERDDGIVFEVDDTGTGIPPEARERLLRPLGEEGHAEAGLGLGLRIASSLAARLGGKLSLSDGPRGGTRASLRLPRVSASPEARERRAGDADGDKQTGH